MRRFLPSIVTFCLSLTCGPVIAGEAPREWSFFPFDNGVGRGVWPPAVQAETVRSLGYEGIHYNYLDPSDFAAKLTACNSAKVPIRAVYLYTFVDKPAEPYDPRFKEVIRMLKGSETIIWLTLRDGKRGKQDADAAKIVREIAALAAEADLKVSLYPHAGFYVASAEDAVRIADLVDLPNVGVSVNLCHELFAGNSGRLGEVLKAAAPRLNLVSINGASPIPGKGPTAWETLPLGSGSFDTANFLRQLRDIGYRGPVGHQFYAVAGDDREKLSKGITAWKRIKAELLGSGAAVEP
ncbi:sugar phosphate isomerase/epimerase [Luteolibacter arcticus]|uniref:Sugar phosphate isomerase/epimerase n=1 Tax=Luteolibacter arcticus TaxID=1581411 RepID=A0ABT3GQH0_9BACT|nr:sugar phosphate isomerase/epimerase [Luteolibacter arcticus]MCW1925713.1 sugar phosphate isomerase/epimerase [Luteolibacter arcticus]